MSILEFTFQSLHHFIGMIILIIVSTIAISEVLSGIAVVIRSFFGQ